MSGEQRLHDALVKRKAVLDERREKGINEWIRSLNRLYDQITEWLQGFIDVELLRVDRRTVPVTGDDCVQYVAPSLVVSDPAGAWKVDFLPTARYVIGDVTGRVDIPFAATKHQLFRCGEGEDATWLFHDDRIRGILPSDKDYMKPLERNILLDALAALLEPWNPKD